MKTARFLALSGTLLLTTAWMSHAYADTDNTCSGGTAPTTCQYYPASNSKAVGPAISKGIKLGNGKSNVLFVYPGLAPRFVDNSSGSNIFIPQSTATELGSYFSKMTSDYGVPDLTVTLPAKDYPGCAAGVFVPASSASVTLPQSTTATHLLGYTRLGYRVEPSALQTTISGSFKFNYSTAPLCVTDPEGNTLCATPTYVQTVSQYVFDAMGTASAEPYFTWNPTPISVVAPTTNALQLTTDGGTTYTTVASCSGAPSPTITGVCGSANGQHVAVIPSTGLCSKGTPSGVTGTGPWTWSCADYPADGTSAACSTGSVPVNGTCGSDDGKTLSAAPTNLCTNGTPGPVTGAGPWSWVCNGTSGGTTSPACSANIMTACPAINFTATGDLKWSVYKGCIGSGTGNWDDNHLMSASSDAECAWPNWPKAGLIGGASFWSGILWPGPTGYAGSPSQQSPPVPGYIGMADWYGTPLLPFTTVRDADYAAGVYQFNTYPGQPAPTYTSGYDEYWATTVNPYSPNDTSIVAANGAMYSSVVGDLYQAITAAVTTPFMTGTLYDTYYNAAMLFCWSDDRSTLYDDYATCFAKHASTPGAHGEVVTNTMVGKTYASGETWSFQISGADALGGCFYDANAAPGMTGISDPGFTKVTNGIFKAYRYTGSASDNKIGTCHVSVTYNRPAGTSTCRSASMPTGGTPPFPYCGATVVHTTGSGDTCDSPTYDTPATPTAPNMSTLIGPQNCSQECYCGRC